MNKNELLIRAEQIKKLSKEEFKFIEHDHYSSWSMWWWYLYRNFVVYFKMLLIRVKNVWGKK